MNIKTLTLLAFVASTAALHGYSVNRWTGAVNDYDWTEPGNFRDGLPSAGDVVQISNKVVKIDVSTENGAASLATINTLKQIWPMDTNSVLEVTVPEGAEASFGIPFTAFPFSNDYEKGELLKKGGGTLNLTSVKNADGERCQDYYTHLHVAGGSLKMAKNVNISTTLGKVTVDSGAFFFPYSCSSGKSPNASSICTLYWRELWGEGTVTNDSPSSSTVYHVRPTNDSYCEFAGVFTKQFRMYTAGGNWQLTGVNSDMAYEIPVVDQNAGKGPDCGMGVLGLKKIGNNGDPSSTGRHSYMVNFRSNGGVLRYIGEGETTDKHITWQDSKYWNFIDGGPHGNLTLAGRIQAYQNSAKTMDTIMNRIMFTGSNAAPCKITGNILYQTKNDRTCIAHPFLGKQGSGTWRIVDNYDNASGRNFGTPFVIEGGKLQYDSIAETNEPCSLGYGNVLMEPFSGAYGDGVPVDWFFRLGRTNATHALPVLEYSGLTRLDDVSLAASHSTTRKIELVGSARLSNASVNAMKFGGVYSSASGDEDVKYLWLGGTNRCGDTVLDVSDGAGKTGVVKDGSGTWTLHGDLTFTGPVDVREGELRIRNSSRYTWFWFKICEVLQNCKRYRGSAAQQNGYTVQLGEIGLFDASGNRLTAGLSTAAATTGASISNHFNIAEGRVAYDTLDFSQAYLTTGADGWAKRGLDKLFDGTLGGAGCSRYQARNGGIRIDVPSSWNGFVFRLPSSVTEEVDSWDVGSIGGFTYGDSNRLVTACSLLASADGVRWTTITNAAPLELARSGAHWVSDHSTGTGAHTGWKMPGRLAVPFSVTPKTAKVASGASLVAEGDGEVVLNGVILDASAGGGTIEGFRFAESGVLDVCGLPEGEAAVDIPVSFSNAEGLSNVSGWTLKLDGEATARKKFKVTSTGVTVTSIGMTVIVR